MLAHKSEACDVPLERSAVRGQYPVDVQALDHFDGIEELRQHIMAGPPAYVGGDLFEDVIAGDEIAVLGRVQTDVAGGMAGRPDHFERAAAHRDALAAFEFPGRHERVAAIASETLVHLFA